MIKGVALRVALSVEALCRQGSRVRMTMADACHPELGFLMVLQVEDDIASFDRGMPESWLRAISQLRGKGRKVWKSWV